jgi:hypothetical protein
MISLEKTEFIYKLFLETINYLANGRWQPRYCRVDFEKAIHLGNQITYILFSYQLVSYFRVNFYEVMTFPIYMFLSVISFLLKSIFFW